MSGDHNLTGGLPTDQMLEKILSAIGALGDRLDRIEERTGRVEEALGIGEAGTQPLSGRVNRLVAEFAEFKDETRDSFRKLDDRLDSIERSLASVQGDAVRRYSRLDERVSALEHPEEAKQP